MNQRAKILVVDDQSVMIKATRLALESAGFETLGAEGGVEGLRVTRECKPDLILLDVDMPDISGFEVCRQVKADPELQETFVIMFSGSRTDSKSRTLGLDLGADGYISRPVTNHELIARVESMLRIREANVALRDAQAEAQRLLEQSEQTRRALLSTLEDQKEVEDALRASEKRYRNLFERVPIGLYRTAPDGRILDANQAMAQMLGYADVPSLLKVNANSLFLDPADRQQESGLLGMKDVVHRYELQLRRPDGSIIWVWDTTRSILDDDGRILYQEGSLEDITERKQAELELADERNLLRTLIDNLPDPVYAKDTQGRYILKNLADLHLMNAASPEEVIGKTDYDYYSPEVAAQLTADDLAVIRSGLPLINREELVTTTDGGQAWLLTTKVPWRDHRGETIGLVGIGHDITERKRVEEMLRSLSLTDDLTRLYNRRGFLLLAEQQLKRAHRMKGNALLLFGDVDSLKNINDTLGHAQGDLALADIAGVLKETFRESDIVARLGGDEFVVLVQDAVEEGAQAVISRVEGGLEARNARGDRSYKLAVSFGIARYDPEAPCTVTDLIDAADSAMYQRKQERKRLKS